jgi:hypothetical protein
MKQKGVGSRRREGQGEMGEGKFKQEMNCIKGGKEGTIVD